MSFILIWLYIMNVLVVNIGEIIAFSLNYCGA